MSAKVYLCTKIEYINADNVVSTTANSIIIKDGYAMEIFNAKKATFTEQLSIAVNDYVTQKLSVSAIGEEKNNSYSGRKYIFRLTLSSGKQIIWGDTDLPVRIQTQNVETNQNNFIFIRTGKSFT